MYEVKPGLIDVKKSRASRVHDDQPPGKVVMPVVSSGVSKKEKRKTKVELPDDRSSPSMLKDEHTQKVNAKLLKKGMAKKKLQSDDKAKPKLPKSSKARVKLVEKEKAKLAKEKAKLVKNEKAKSKLVKKDKSTAKKLKR